MLYDFPNKTVNHNIPKWPTGAGSIAGVLPDGTPIDIPVLKGVNVLTFGVVGTGKTCSYNEKAAEILLDVIPDLKGVFFETKHSFVDHFMSEGDMVIAHNPNAVPTGNRFIPNIVKEIRQSKDPEGEMRDIAEFLFAELLQGANRNRAWIEAARNSFVGILRVIVDCFPDSNTGNGTLVNALRRMSTKEILVYLARHPRNHSMLRKDWGMEDLNHPENYNEKRAGDISFFLNSALELFSGSFEMDGTNTIHDWLNGKYGRNMFFLYDLASSEISRPFFMYYLKKIKDFKLSNAAGNTAPILMCLDEVDKMAENGKTADWGIYQAANLGREYGLQLLLTTQSVENLYGLSTDFNEHTTMGGLAGFPYLVSFRPGDPTTLSTLQSLYGSEYKEHVVLPDSRYVEPIVKCELEPIVTDAEFASLHTGDCIIKIMSHRPRRVHINRNSNF